MPITRRIGGSCGSPKGSVQSSTPFASISCSASSLLLPRTARRYSTRLALLEAMAAPGADRHREFDFASVPRGGPGSGAGASLLGRPPVTGSIVSETVLIMLSMANVVAIISVLSTALVAIAIPFINARLERRRLAWQSKQAQVDELRRFLDDATLRIQEATVVLWEILDVPFPQGPPRTMERLATMERSTFSEDELSRIGALAEVRAQVSGNHPRQDTPRSSTRPR
jgi:hypothetical protein